MYCYQLKLRCSLAMIGIYTFIIQPEENIIIRKLQMQNVQNQNLKRNIAILVT